MTQEFKVPGVLCYVDGDTAYFTTAPLQQQWGDDWNDAPYEHNAGTPYRDVTFVVTEVNFRPGDMGQPCDYTFNNSPWSVEMINTGVTPWLSTVHGGSGRDPVHIFAGATFAEFQAALVRAGGTALMPVLMPVPPDAAAGA